MRAEEGGGRVVVGWVAVVGRVRWVNVVGGGWRVVVVVGGWGGGGGVGGRVLRVVGLEVGVVVSFELVVFDIGVEVRGIVAVGVPVGNVCGRRPLFWTCWGGCFEGAEGG